MNKAALSAQLQTARSERDDLLEQRDDLLAALKALKLEHESWCSSSRPQAFNPVYREWIGGGAVSRQVMSLVDAAIAKAEGRP